MNILTHPVHTGYQYDLAKTGHEFYSIEIPGSNEVFWDQKSRPLPNNYHRLEALRDAPVAFDLILVHFDLGYNSLKALDLPLIFKEHCLREPFVVPKSWRDRISYYSFASQAAATRWILPNEEAYRKAIIGMGMDLSTYKNYDGTGEDILVVGQHIRSRGNEKGRDNLLQLSKQFKITIVGRGSEGLPGGRGPAANYEQLLEYYRSHKVFLNPSGILGMSTLEAMATGMPVVTFRTVNSDLIQNGVNGLIVDSVAEAEMAITGLLRDTNLSKQLGCKARQTIQERFRSDVFVQRWNTLFRQAVYEYHCHAEPLVWKPFDLNSKSPEERTIAQAIINTEFEYHRVGFDKRNMTFRSDGRIGKGAAGCEMFWDIRMETNDIFLEISSGCHLTCRLKLEPDGIWKGRWFVFEKMPIHLVPLSR